MAKQAKKQTKVPQEKPKYQSNVIQFSSIKRTRSGWAVFVGKNVLFINDSLLNYINKNQTKKAS